MTGRVRYSKAPIIEATISLGVVSRTDLSVRDLLTVGRAVQARFPTVREEHLYAGEVSVPQPGEPPEHDDTHEHTGYSFSSEDGQRSFHARLDGFDFSVTQPYDRWESFRDEARELWKLFREVAGVRQIVQVAVRYINRIDIPVTPSVRIEDYAKVYPEIPDDWPSGDVVSSFFLQLQMWQQDLGCMLVVNEAPARAPKVGVTSLRLDFDLFKERYDDPWQADDDTEVWVFLEKLRERKNEVFEASITDATRRLIR